MKEVDDLHDKADYKKCYDILKKANFTLTSILFQVF